LGKLKVPRIGGKVGAVNMRSELGGKLIKGKPCILLPQVSHLEQDNRKYLIKSIAYADYFSLSRWIGAVRPVHAVHRTSRG